MDLLAAPVVVKAFLGFVSRRSFRAFAWYRIACGLVLLGYYFAPAVLPGRAAPGPAP